MGFFDFFKKLTIRNKSASHNKNEVHTKLNTAPTIQERRQEARHETSLSTVLQHNEQIILATIINLSKTGLGILAGKSFDKNELFEVSIPHKKNNSVILSLCVQSCRKIDDDYLVGAKVVSACANHAQLFNAIRGANVAF